MRFFKIIITLVILSITANAEVKFQVNLKNGIINITDDKMKFEVTTKIENIDLYHYDNIAGNHYILNVQHIVIFNLTEKEYNEIKRELLYGTFNG
jgi:hypothetical protein